MALKHFSRHPKNPTDDEATPEEVGGLDQFFSHGARPGGTSSNSVDQGEIVVGQEESAPVPVVETAEAGWYADASDPQTKRYWDGHHWTGQTMRVVLEDSSSRVPSTPAPTTGNGQTVLAQEEAEPVQPTPPLMTASETDTVTGGGGAEIDEKDGGDAAGTSSPLASPAADRSKQRSVAEVGANGPVQTHQTIGEADRWFAEIAGRRSGTGDGYS